jgi:hypothetical protein
MPERNPRSDRGLIYLSPHLWKLRLATLVSLIPAAACVWLLSAGPAEWPAATGHSSGWLYPMLLVGVLLLLPAALLVIHGRYVTRVVLEFDGCLSVTTFVLWGERTEKLKTRDVSTRRFWLDRDGDAPLGFETLAVLGFRPPGVRRRA